MPSVNPRRARLRVAACAQGMPHRRISLTHPEMRFFVSTVPLTTFNVSSARCKAREQPAVREQPTRERDSRRDSCRDSHQGGERTMAWTRAIHLQGRKGLGVATRHEATSNDETIRKRLRSKGSLSDVVIFWGKNPRKSFVGNFFRGTTRRVVLGTFLSESTMLISKTWLHFCRVSADSVINTYLNAARESRGEDDCGVRTTHKRRDASSYLCSSFGGLCRL